MQRHRPHQMSVGERYQQIIPRLQHQQYLPTQTTDTPSISRNSLRLHRRQLVKPCLRPPLELPSHRLWLHPLRTRHRLIVQPLAHRRLTHLRLLLQARPLIRLQLFTRRSHHTVHRPRPAPQPAPQATQRRHTTLQPLQRPLTRLNPVHRSQPAP